MSSSGDGFSLTSRARRVAPRRRAPCSMPTMETPCDVLCCWCSHNLKDTPSEKKKRKRKADKYMQYICSVDSQPH